MTFEKIAQEVPLDKRGKIKSEIWFPTLFHFKDILDYQEDLRAKGFHEKKRFSRPPVSIALT